MEGLWNVSVAIPMKYKRHAEIRTARKKYGYKINYTNQRNPLCAKEKEGECSSRNFWMPVISKCSVVP